jgi:hypothetical protein
MSWKDLSGRLQSGPALCDLWCHWRAPWSCCVLQKTGELG